MTIHGILVAAGRGIRFGGPKHLHEIGGKPMWQRARDSLLYGGVNELVIVGEVPGGIEGGERRRDSVAAGLDAIGDSADFVVVHDAARPLATPDLARRIIDRLLSGGVDAVVPVIPVTDTLKRVGDGWVLGTVDRSGINVAQTPQGFKVAALRSAHAATDDDASDDAVLIERL